MRKSHVGRFLMFLPLGLAAIALVGLLVMALWNALLPPLFGWKAIGYWQAWGLLILARLLFGGFRGSGGSGRHWRHRLKARWERMTPEERERFRQELDGRWGGPASAEAKPSAGGGA